MVLAPSHNHTANVAGVLNKFGAQARQHMSICNMLAVLLLESYTELQLQQVYCMWANTTALALGVQLCTANLECTCL